MGLMALVDTEVSVTLCDMTFSAGRRETNHLLEMTFACLSFTAVPHQLTQVRAHGGHKTRDRSPRRHDTAIFQPFVCILSAFSHSDIDDYVPKRKNL